MYRREAAFQVPTDIKDSHDEVCCRIREFIGRSARNLVKVFCTASLFTLHEASAERSLRMCSFDVPLPSWLLSSSADPLTSLAFLFAKEVGLGKRQLM
jgi:hypothetical protein